MWQFSPSNALRGTAWYSCRPFKSYSAPLGTEELPIGASFKEAFGVFRAVQITSATTTIVATASPGGSLLMTDLVVSAKKVAGTTLIVEFDDGVNTEIISDPDSVNQSVNFSWTPFGRIQGWTDAAVKVVTTGANTVATVTVGYVKLPDSISFSEWNDLR